MISRKRQKIGFVSQTPEFRAGGDDSRYDFEKCVDPDESIMKAYELISHLELSDFGLAIRN